MIDPKLALFMGGTNLGEDRWNDPFFVIMTALPGAGKTTFRRKLFDDKWVHVSTDDYIEDVAKEIGLTYSEVFSDTIDSATKAMNLRADEAFKNGRDIVWDQTNLTIKKRAKLLNRAPKQYIPFSVYVTTDADTRAVRLNTRPGKTIPQHIDDSMVDSLQRPSITEGFHAVVEVHT